MNQTNLAADRTIREVVVTDYRTAAVFQKYELDFCCGGGATIEQACHKKGVDVERLIEDLNVTLAAPSAGEPRFGMWSPELLIDYILQNHHTYVRSVLPTIQTHAEKVARVHGAKHPAMVSIEEKFILIAEEMLSHMMKEERVLFPYIWNLAQAKEKGLPVKASPFATVHDPIQVMLKEHEAAGDEMAEIRELTNNYMPPPDACTTYRVLFKELQEFEQDLHRHVHVENNILVPAAIRLEEELNGGGRGACMLN